MIKLDQEIEVVKRAAIAMMEADKVLIVTGAGMSADSGVATYRDEHGKWRDYKPFTSKGITPRDVAHLEGYRRDPSAAWGFHEHVRRTMSEAEPHRGYDVITRWVESLCPQAFLLTSNIDGFHLRSGVARRRLWQRYGSIWELQCVESCQPGLWWSEPESPLCHLDLETMRAVDLPRCPFCGAPSRPRIQMDHDPDFIQDAYGARLYENFIADDDVDLYVIVGTTLWLSWPEADDRERKVIHINPNPETHGRYDDPIGITMGAEDALLGIDWMTRRCAQLAELPTLY